MTRACPIGHPSAPGMRACPLCGRAYVAADQVVPPPSKDEVLAAWRARRRAERDAAAPAVAEAEPPLVPAARTSPEEGVELRLDEASTTWTRSIEVAPKLLSVGAAAMFVTAFALGEGVALGFLA